MVRLDRWPSGPNRTSRHRKGGGKVYVLSIDGRDPDPLLTRMGFDGPRREQLRVLVAEDDRGLRDDAASHLSRHGMSVVKVDAARDIEPVLRRFRPHVIVLDDHFERSGVSFKALLPNLIGAYPEIGVVVTTDKRNTKPDEALTWGAASVIDKATMFQGTALEDTVKGAAGL